MEGIYGIKDFVIRILRKWKFCLIMGIIFSIALGGIQVVHGYQNLQSTEEDFDEEEAAWLENRDNMKESLDILEERLSNWSSYYSKSKLMEIDSYNAERYVIVCVVETEGIGNLSLAEACVPIIEQDDFYADISKEVDISENDLKELILTKSNLGMFMIKGYKYKDVDIALAVEKFYDKILNSINNLYTGQCKIHKVSANYYSGKDDDLIRLQDSALTNGERYVNEQKSRKVFLDNLDTQSPVEEISYASIVKDSVLYGVIGLVGGIIFAIIIGIAKDIMSRKLYDQRELESYGLKCLGSNCILPSRNKGIIDRKIDELYTKEDLSLSDDEWADYIVERILRERSNIKELLLTGTVVEKHKSERLDMLQQKLKNNAIEAYVLGNPVNTAQTVKKLGEINEVVLIEKTDNTDMVLLEEMLKLIEGMKKDILGFILV